MAPTSRRTAPRFCLHLLQGSFPPVARHDLEEDPKGKDPKMVVLLLVGYIFLFYSLNWLLINGF